MMKMRFMYSILLAVLVSTDAIYAVELADALGDHMVLQRNKSVPIWGTAQPGEQVTVTFAGQSQTAITNPQGRWAVRFKPLAASSESRELTVSGSSSKILIKDVLVGDVWIAGGQSNMGRDVNRSWRPVDQKMDYPHIRFLRVTSRGSKYPQSSLVTPPPSNKEYITEQNKWNVCSGRATLECCAVGFFFAERIYQETGIPQGLLWNAWGGECGSRMDSSVWMAVASGTGKDVGSG